MNCQKCNTKNTKTAKFCKSCGEKLQGNNKKKNNGKICPYCHAVIKPSSETITCPKCVTAHHKECWDENKGCAVYGCTYKKECANILVGKRTPKSNTESNEKAAGFCIKGHLKCNLKDYIGAIDEFTKSIKLEPDKAAVSYFGRAFAKSEIQDKEGALQDYTKVIDLEPANSLAYFNRGLVKEALKDDIGAIEDYTNAINFNSEYIESYLNRGRLRVGIEEYQAALEDLNKVIEKEPNNAIALGCRGIAKYFLKNEKSALNDLNKAVMLGYTAANEFIDFIKLTHSAINSDDYVIKGLEENIIYASKKSNQSDSFSLWHVLLGVVLFWGVIIYLALLSEM